MNEIQATEYQKRLENHIQYVKEAGLKVGVLLSQLQKHDRSKWSRCEFGPYARMFINEDGTEVVDFENRPKPVDYQYAWLHHIHQNPHHWEHWIFPGRWSPESATGIVNGVMRMPAKYALEMIADWMGASKAYTDSWNIGPWLIENASTITVHPETACYLRDALTSLDYGDIMQVAVFNSP